ncbi:MAG: FIST N-terminal domain-containing protein [Candidatus Omnitrophota bacterium]
MQFASAITQEKDPAQAVSILVQEIRMVLPQNPHLALLFVSTSYEAEWKYLVPELRRSLGFPLLIGCSSSGVIGHDLELEFLPAMSLVAAYLPDVMLHPFMVSPIELELSYDTGKRWTSHLGVSKKDFPSFIIIPEPLSCNASKLLEDLNQDFSRQPVVGGLASGSGDLGGNFLFLNDEVFREGAVGVALTGNIALETIVSQGCRPIGERYIVTEADDNVLIALRGKPAIEVLQDLFSRLSPQDRGLAQHALFLGLAADEMRPEFKRGDFLIRNIVGADPMTGALLIGERLSVGQTVQFHLRDAKTSEEDLRVLLKALAPSFKSRPPRGMVVFNCQGRGKGLYGTSHHDIRIIRSFVGESAIAGFFSNGEIGPVGGKACLHGYTSSLGIFREKQLKEV